MLSLPCKNTHVPMRHLLPITDIHPAQSDSSFHLHKEFNPSSAPPQPLLLPTCLRTQWSSISAAVQPGHVSPVSSPLETVAVPGMKDGSHLRSTDVWHTCHT